MNAGPGAPGTILARIAHDLRGPLMPLRTAAWLLRNELGTPGRAGELADIIDRQSARLARMMDELSDWGRCTGDQFPLECVPLEVGLAVDMAIGPLECQAQVRCTGATASATVHADQHRLGQLLRTLVEHAAQRAPGLPVEVEVSADDEVLRIRVRDHGPALEPAAREGLLTQPQPVAFDHGLGLRLLLARRIAEAHAGHLSIDDATHAGLALLLTLPLRG